MWWILVIIIIAVVVMGSENEGKYKEDKYKEDEQKQWEKQIAPYARVKYAKITYVPHSPYGEKFTLVHQIDVKTDSIYGRGGIDILLTVQLLQTVQNRALFYQMRTKKKYHCRKMCI